MPRIERQHLLQVDAASESSAAVRQRVGVARERQLARQRTPNALLAPRELDRHCALDSATRNLLEQAMTRLSLSARGVHRVLRVARTIADLADQPALASSHLAEALRYRELDRTLAA